MNKVIFRITVNKSAVPALKAALLTPGDSAALATALDNVLVFEGVAGAIVEKLDGLAFQELAQVIVDALDEAV